MKKCLCLSHIGKQLALIILAWVMVGCSAAKDSGIRRIALLAPFEGRNSEVGYNAYYAVRLALRDKGNDSIELLAIDDGGTHESAIGRAQALARDPLVKVVIALGSNATQPEAQQAFGDVPIIVVGQWQTKPTTPNMYILASAELDKVETPFDRSLSVTDAAEIQKPVIGGEIFALSQFPMLSPNTDNVTIVSSGNLPDADFRQRYLSSAEYVPEPGLLASLSYDAAGIAIAAIESSNPNETIANGSYSGLNGQIRFADGYWANAPVHYFKYDKNGKLTSENRPIK